MATRTTPRTTEDAAAVASDGRRRSTVGRSKSADDGLVAQVEEEPPEVQKRVDDDVRLKSFISAVEFIFSANF